MVVSLPLNSQTMIDLILKEYPKLAEVFNGYGMACVGCVFSRFHTATDAALIYHLDLEDFMKSLSHTFTEIY